MFDDINSESVSTDAESICPRCGPDSFRCQDYSTGYSQAGLEIAIESYDDSQVRSRVTTLKDLLTPVVEESNESQNYVSSAWGPF